MYIGIDFGTSFSQVAVDNNNNVLPLVSAGVYGVPSVFYYDSASGEIVGDEAEDLAQGINAKNIVREVKMKLDQSFTLDDRVFSAKEIVRKIYRATVEYAQDEGEKNIMDFKVDGIVITHPAKFNMKEVNALCESARNCIDPKNPLLVVGALKEPVAAAIAYYKDTKDRFDDGDGILVFDLGGGTCDVALVQVNKQDDAEYTVVDSDMERIGGRDWDKALFDYAVGKIAEATNGAINVIGNDNMENELKKAVILTKHMLSKRDATAIRPSIPSLYSYPDLAKGIAIKREDFEMLTAELLNSVMDKLSEVYSRNCQNLKIKEIICVGGSSNMPQIKEAIENRFSNCVIRLYKPEYATVSGAAIFANKIMNKLIKENYGIYTGGSDPVVKETTELVMREILNDILPFSYGVRCRKSRDTDEFVIQNILKRGDRLPASSSYDKFKIAGSGTSVQIEVYESECLDNTYPLNGAANERVVGKIQLDIPKGVRESDRVKCTLTITGLDTIKLEAHDNKGDSIQASFKLN